jgi:hypothetical protein
MNLNITHAEMNKDEEGLLLGKTVFTVDGHKEAYEVTFFSKRGKEWDYSLHFHAEPGDEEQLLTVDTYLENNDDAFDALLDAALDVLPE